MSELFVKKQKVFTGILIAVFVIQLLFEGLAAFMIFRLNMLPPVFAAILGGLFAFFALLTGLLMFFPRKGETPGLARRIIAIVLAVLTILGSGLAYIIANDVYKTIDGVTTPEVSRVTRSIYVRADDPAQKIADTADYTYAAVENYDVDSTQQALKVIETELAKAVEVKYFPSVPEMVEALYAEKVDALILNSAYVLILEDMEGYEDFSQKTRLLQDVPVTEWVPPVEETEPVETQPEEKEQNITNTPFAIYISGSDTRSSYLPTSTRSDVNILVIVNPETKQVLLLNTPRDYYVENPAGGGSRDKLTHCGIYGVDCSIKTLEALYSVDVDYYARINFTGFETLIDAIGGITVYVDSGFSTVGSTYVGAGENYMNGKEALAFARERYNVAGGDNGRGKNQMKVITAVIKKLTSGTTIISNYSQILSSLQGMFVTSMAMDEISSLVKMQLTDMASWDIHSFAVTGKNGSAVTYSAPGQNLSVMFVNDELVAHASELIDKVIDGQILTNADITGS